MIIIEQIVGNSQDPQWQTRLADAEIDWLLLDQWEAQKSRLRKSTAQEVELALSLDRNTHLHDGDILVWNEADRRAIVARIELNDVLVIDLTDVIATDRDTLVRTMFELGHAIGNQHWPAIVKGSRIFVPLTVDRKVMASVMKTHAFPHVHYDFMSGAEVIPYMAPHEARRLFGGATAASHSHSHTHPGHQDRHTHEDNGHRHGHGHDH